MSSPAQLPDSILWLQTLPYPTLFPAIILVCIAIGRFGLLMGRGAAGMTMILWRGRLRRIESLEVAFGWVWSVIMVGAIGFTLPLLFAAPIGWIIVTPFCALACFFAYTMWRDNN